MKNNSLCLSYYEEYFVLVQNVKLMATSTTKHQLTIGGLIFPGMDQCDFTGPFTVLSRVPHSRFLTLWKELEPVTDLNGLRLLPDTTLREAPQLDVLLVPGGKGQEDLMTDEVLLAFLLQQAARARYMFSVCTGALLCGAAGLLQGRRATTHWASLDVLPYYGAAVSTERVVVDGSLITTGGITAGIDGALQVAALLRGDTVAQEIQLDIAYDPQPAFSAGSPATAPADVLHAVRARTQALTDRRLAAGRAYQAAAVI
jgi:cyclohexyl-isocyanide hydratase